jgi:hypothetical protein
MREVQDLDALGEAIGTQILKSQSIDLIRNGVSYLSLDSGYILY